MKLVRSFVFAAAAVLAASTSAAAAVDKSPRQLYHVTLPKSALDAAIATFGDELDIWKAAPVDGDKVQADIYVKPSTIAKFQAVASNGPSIASSSVVVERDAVTTADFLAERAQVRATCSTRTAGWLDDVPAATKYVDNAFFDCFRKPDEVYSFLDSLVAENPTLISKIPQVTTTYEGRVVPGYKISTGTIGRKSIYTQALIHAREWHAGSSGYYTIAALLDALRSGDAAVTGIFAEYDWYFVPILNLDGHLYSWSTNRLWRKNRRPTGTSTFGVDLNRNYGPVEFFNKGKDSKASETYPGTAVLSEPETAGSFAFLSNLPNLRGAIDLHSYSGLVLRPFANQRATAPAPYGAKLKTLGDNVAKAVVANNSAKYVSQTGAELYLAYGVFTDSIFSELNKTVALTFELEGTSFIVSESVIRSGGRPIYQGLVQFAKELQAYYA